MRQLKKIGMDQKSLVTFINIKSKNSYDALVFYQSLTNKAKLVRVQEFAMKTICTYIPDTYSPARLGLAKEVHCETVSRAFRIAASNSHFLNGRVILNKAKTSYRHP